ncbi:hypothetical protein BJ138DRAFT_665153, partial [Hygrophoropsis aurantiaca]
MVEVVIAEYITHGDISARVREFEAFADRDHITHATWQMAASMANFPFMLQIFPQEYDDRSIERTDFTWVRRDVVVHVTTHLDDATALQAAILRTVEVCVEDEDRAEKRPSVLFGVAFSVNHCAIVRVSREDDGAGSFQYTPALQFVPSFFADSPSTPGITALARLGNRPDPDVMQRALWRHLERSLSPYPMTYRLAERNGLPHEASKFSLAHHRQRADGDDTTPSASIARSAAERLSLEIWTLIASLVADFASLVNFGC